MINPYSTKLTIANKYFHNLLVMTLEKSCQTPHKTIWTTNDEKVKEMEHYGITLSNQHSIVKAYEQNYKLVETKMCVLFNTIHTS